MDAFGLEANVSWNEASMNSMNASQELDESENDLIAYYVGQEVWVFVAFVVIAIWNGTADPGYHQKQYRYPIMCFLLFSFLSLFYSGTIF